ncbi:hypothetical protein [Larkinella soli]|uniref:hypothetical protein n=1 Tax=Larkinella soli TaxID=1770527 RepID=UPI000FFBDE2C|nr:hypothetical protein [Larkinella soli]
MNRIPFGRFPRLAVAILLTTLLTAHTGPGDDPACTEQARQFPREWQYKPEWLTDPAKSIPKQSLQPVFERQDKIIRLFRQAYPSPRGLEARAYRGAGYDPDQYYALEPAGGPLRYSTTTYFKHYWCFRGKIELSGETGTWLECYVNHLKQFMEPVGLDLTNGQEAFYMPYKVGELKGYPVYSIRQNEKGNKRESIVITADGRLPVRPISREELVRAMQKVAENHQKEFEETNRQLEAALKESNAYADKIAFKSEAEREKYKRDNQRSMEDGYKKRLKTAQEYRDGAKRLEGFLQAMTPQQRAAQAILTDPTELLLNYRGKGTFEEQEKTGRPLVTHDFSFADRRLPRHAVQSIQLYLRYEEAADMVAKRELMRQFRETIDLDGFRAMLERK